MSQAEFAEVNPDVTNLTLSSHRGMPTMLRKPIQRVRFTCDADDNSITELDKNRVPNEHASVDK